MKKRADSARNGLNSKKIPTAPNTSHITAPISSTQSANDHLDRMWRGNMKKQVSNKIAHGKAMYEKGFKDGISHQQRHWREEVEGLKFQGEFAELRDNRLHNAALDAVLALTDGV